MSATTPAKERRRARARRDIAQAAVELFEAKGFSATTTEEIADAADISQSTFFRHFARKEDPIFYDLDERLEAMKAEFARPDHATAWQTIRAAFISNARTGMGTSVAITPPWSIPSLGLTTDWMLP